MQSQISPNIIKECFTQLSQLSLLNNFSISQLIHSYCPITLTPLQSLPPLPNLSKAISLQQQFYEQTFIPSPQLMLSYQQTYLKSMRGDQKVGLVNYKLKNLYSTNLGNNTAIKNQSKKPITNAYQTINRQYGAFKDMAENKRVFLEDRQHTILQSLKKNQFQQTIPAIEESLLKHQMQNLKNKNVNIQNVNFLDKWKSKRQSIQKKI